jgi:hypothetical protein
LFNQNSLLMIHRKNRLSMYTNITTATKFVEIFVHPLFCQMNQSRTLYVTKKNSLLWLVCYYMLYTCWVNVLWIQSTGSVLNCSIYCIPASQAADLQEIFIFYWPIEKVSANTDAYPSNTTLMNGVSWYFRGIFLKSWRSWSWRPAY